MLKTLAKKIITSPPLSTKYTSAHIPRRLVTYLEKLDIDIQNWALAKSDFFSQKDWGRVQIKKLRNILVHAGSSVPYWQKLFRKLDLDPERFRDFDDLSKIPIITRTDIKKIPIENLLAKKTPQHRFVRSSTSGSTGEPFVFFQDTRDVFRRRINTYQEIRYMGLSPKDIFLVLGLGARRDLDDMRFRINPADLDSDERAEDISSLVLSLGNFSLMTTPSYLHSFLRFCKKMGLRPKINAIIYYGEVLNAEDHKVAEDFFNCNIYSTYGTTECSLVGTQCRLKNFHLAPWMNYVEIIKGLNGGPGRIVVTFFENYAMPFIRYDIGDLGYFRNSICACGVGTGIIELAGRSLGNIQFSNGKSYPLSFMLQHISDNYSAEIERVQFEQSGDGLRLIVMPTGNSRQFEDVRQKLKEYFNKIFDNRASVVIDSSGRFFINQGGKTPLIYNAHER